MIPALLLGFAVIFLAGSIVAAGLFDSTPLIFGCTAVALACGVGAVVVGINQDSDACHAKGGRMVPDGPPYYIKSGEMLVPFQPERCERP